MIIKFILWIRNYISRGSDFPIFGGMMVGGIVSIFASIQGVSNDNIGFAFGYWIVSLTILAAIIRGAHMYSEIAIPQGTIPFNEEIGTPCQLKEEYKTTSRNLLYDELSYFLKCIHNDFWVRVASQDVDMELALFVDHAGPINLTKRNFTELVIVYALYTQSHADNLTAPAYIKNCMFSYLKRAEPEQRFRIYFFLREEFGIKMPYIDTQLHALGVL